MTRTCLAVAALLAAVPLAGASLPVARVHAFHPACSRAQAADLAGALAQADALLRSRCGLGLSLTAWTELPVNGGLCHLPADAAERSAALRRLSAALKAPAPRELALLLLPADADERLSWALVDVSRRSACDSPQEARFLPRFGSIFFNELSLDLGPAVDGVGRPALLLAHEVLHSLTQRGHPSRAPRGSVMADHVADLGPAIGADWCACARRSPYLFPAQP